MFGFVVANPERLTEEQRTRYKAVYCGLCEELGNGRSSKCKMLLTYDLVFLSLVLSSVYGEEYEETEDRCFIHPIKKRKFLSNRFTRYAADMNIALSYYKLIDDVNDDNSYSAYLKTLLFKKEMADIEKKYPTQCDIIKSCLSDLAETEKNGVLIPDVPAASFGRLLGGIFSYEEGEYKEALYEFGYSLGKFIYVIDAAVDLKKDVKKQKYNPFVRFSFNDIEPILRMIMADCVEKYNKLPVIQDREIADNILLSGVWTAYDSRKKGNKSEQRSI